MMDWARGGIGGRSSLQTLLVVLATSASVAIVADANAKTDADTDANTLASANHEGVHCDCSTQGRWQPLFKPSQILHSEFPEHKYSDSTGGPRPSDMRTVKILPHLVVPLINPLAISIHHGQSEQTYNEVNSNSIVQGTPRKKKKNRNKLKKGQYYNYGYPRYKAPTYNKEIPSTQRPYNDGQNLDEHYHNDSSQENEENFDDGTHHHEDNPDDVSTEGGTSSGEDTFTRGYDTTGSSGPGPDPTLSTVDDHYSHGYYNNNNNNNNDNYNNEEEGSTVSPSYYNSEEHKEPVYDSSKYAPHHVESSNAFKFNDFKVGGSKKHRDVNKYHGSGTRGKALRQPAPSNLHSSSETSYKSSPSTKYKSHKRRPPKSLTYPRSPVPATLHSDLFHPPPPPPLAPEVSPTAARVLPDRAPIYHAHPPIAILTPLKIILREEAKRITLLRPPAPGMHHTWTFETPLASRSNEIALLKKPRVLYVMKTVPRNTISLIK